MNKRWWWFLSAPCDGRPSACMQPPPQPASSRIRGGKKKASYEGGAAECQPPLLRPRSDALKINTGGSYVWAYTRTGNPDEQSIKESRALAALHFLRVLALLPVSYSTTEQTASVCMKVWTRAEWSGSLPESSQELFCLPTGGKKKHQQKSGQRFCLFLIQAWNSIWTLHKLLTYVWLSEHPLEMRRRDGGEHLQLPNGGVIGCSRVYLHSDGFDFPDWTRLDGVRWSVHTHTGWRSEFPHGTPALVSLGLYLESGKQKQDVQQEAVSVCCCGPDRSLQTVTASFCSDGEDAWKMCLQRERRAPMERLMLN